jgi:hypothetical protein
VTRYPHIDYYTDKEVEEIWYSEIDFAYIRQECTDTIRMMVNKESLDKDQYCCRGLECKTPKGAKYRRNNKFIGIQTVLDEQSVQQSEGMDDPVYMAELYKSLTENSIRRSHLMAVRDEKAVNTSSPAIVIKKSTNGTTKTKDHCGSICRATRTKRCSVCKLE